MTDPTIKLPPGPWSDAATKVAGRMILTDVQSILWAFMSQAESETLDLDPKDRGNWTSGIIGIGELKGSKFGISAASFPHIDIAAVTYASAQEICMTQFWPAIQGDVLANSYLTPALAMLMTDTAWNSGPVEAIEILQHALGGLGVDGVFGNQTKSRLQYALEMNPSWQLVSGEAVLLANYTTQRLIFETGLSGWEHDKGGWIHRVTLLHGLAHRFLKVGADQRPSGFIVASDMVTTKGTISG